MPIYKVPPLQPVGQSSLKDSSLNRRPPSHNNHVRFKDLHDDKEHSSPLPPSSNQSVSSNETSNNRTGPSLTNGGFRSNTTEAQMSFSKPPSFVIPPSNGKPQRRAHVGGVTSDDTQPRSQPQQPHLQHQQEYQQHQQSYHQSQQENLDHGLQPLDKPKRHYKLEKHLKQHQNSNHYNHHNSNHHNSNHHNSNQHNSNHQNSNHHNSNHHNSNHHNSNHHNQHNSKYHNKNHGKQLQQHQHHQQQRTHFKDDDEDDEKNNSNNNNNCNKTNNYNNKNINNYNNNYNTNSHNNNDNNGQYNNNNNNTNNNTGQYNNNNNNNNDDDDQEPHKSIMEREVELQLQREQELLSMRLQRNKLSPSSFSSSSSSSCSSSSLNIHPTFPLQPTAQVSSTQEVSSNGSKMNGPTPPEALQDQRNENGVSLVEGGLEREVILPQKESVLEKEVRVARQREGSLRRARGFRLQEVEKGGQVEVSLLVPSSLKLPVPSRPDVVDAGVTKMKNNSQTFATNRLKMEMFKERQRELAIKDESKVIDDGHEDDVENVLQTGEIRNTSSHNFITDQHFNNNTKFRRNNNNVLHSKNNNNNNVSNNNVNYNNDNNNINLNNNNNNNNNKNKNNNINSNKNNFNKSNNNDNEDETTTKSHCFVNLKSTKGKWNIEAKIEEEIEACQEREEELRQQRLHLCSPSNPS